MARKPTKKRNLVRRPVKAATAVKPKPFNPNFKLKIGTVEDPFFVHPETIPDGAALQWVAEPAFMQQALRSGWRPVEGQDEVQGQTLMWAPVDLAEAQDNADNIRAKQQMAEARALFGMDESRPSPYHSGIRIVGPDFVLTQAYESVPSDAPPLDVEVIIKVRVSARWQDAAAGLGLGVEEYTRRRLIMESIVLGPIYEYDSEPKRIYEPVELLTKRMD